MKYVISLLLSVMIWLQAAYAEESPFNEQVRVAVVVGDTAITTVDIRNRINLALFSAGLSADPQVVQRLIPQVIRMLIDEQLYKQEASRLNIVVSPHEIDNAKRSIESKNGLKEGELEEFLLKKGVPFTALEEQLYAQLLWNKIVQRRVRTKVSVTDKEVDEKLENIAHRVGMTEYDLSEIALPVDSPENDNDVKKLIGELLDEIKKGADFQAVAREFSQGVTAKKGGEVGWVALDDLPKTIAVVVQDLQKGEISQPVRTTDGYYIVRVNNKRTLVVPDKKESEIGLRQAFVFFNGKDDAVRKLQAQEVQQAKQSISSCNNFEDFAKTVGSKVDPKMVMTQYRSLNDDIREALESLDVGEVSPVIRSSKGLHVFMICEKTEAVASLAEKRKVRDSLFAQKVSLQSRRYIRNLRRNAFIEVRL